MTLRATLGLALTFAALLPMAVVVGWPILQAGSRAEEETAELLAAARRQVTIVIERRKDDTASRMDQVAADLAGDRSARRFLRQGTGAQAAAIVRSLAVRYGLDHLEIRNKEGDLLSSWPDGTARERPAMLDGADGGGEVVLRPLPPAPGRERAPVAFVTRRTVADDHDALDLLGGRAVAQEFVAGLSELTGSPAALLDRRGRVVESAGAGARERRRIAAAVPIGDRGWRLRVSVPPADPWKIRRDLLASFAGVAPIALICALLVGVILAGGIARPIRALASRAHDIASARAAGPLSLVHERNEVRRLTRSFDQMLEALSHSEHQRGAAEKIAAWQEVARRVAHEVKNPLSPIKLAVENLRRTRHKAPAEFDRSLREETDTILEEVESLRRMVDEFSLFARMPAPQPVVCDLRPLLSQALLLFAPRIEALGVQLEVESGDGPQEALADPEQIGRALKNVLANALDALESVDDRRLWATVRRAPATPRDAHPPWFEITIRDSGAGLAPEALQRMFEPYFTTRAAAGGTGLGMAIAYRIVTEHGGTIRASGAPGRGAAITIRLPASESAKARA